MNIKVVVKALEGYTRYVRRPTCHEYDPDRHSCDVADALSKLKVPHGGFLAGLTM